MKRFIAGFVGLVVLLYSSQGHAVELMGQWKFEEGAGTVAIDSSGNGFNGIIYGNPTWVPDGRSGLAIHFDGVDDYIEIPNTSDWNFASAFTLKASVRMSGPAGNPDAWIITKHLSGVHAGYGLGVSGPANLGPNEVVFMVQPGEWPPGYERIWGGSYQDGNWHDIMGVYNRTGATSLDLYVDGQLKAHKDTWAYTSFNDQNIRIGAYFPGYGDVKFLGDIDEVQVWSVALPEPSTLVLLAVAALISLLAYAGRRWKRAGRAVGLAL